MKALRTYKILAVDDYVENLQVIVRIAEEMGPEYEVLQAIDAETAFEIAKDEIPDLIITDWEMPGMNGIELIKRLRMEKSSRLIPVIMYTGIMTTSDNLATALDAGAVDFIRKPIDPVEFRARVLSMLQLSESFQTIKMQMELVQAQTQEIIAEKQKSEKLLLNILPEKTARELKRVGSTRPVRYESVSVLFTDFKGFTKLAEEMSAEELVQEIHFCFSRFDEIMTRHNVEKIKTIGDAYMAAGGLPTQNNSHAMDVVKAALEIKDFMEKLKLERDQEGRKCFELRLGIHTGSVVAGIVGINKFQYDIWGDTVNVAARMESSGEVGKVNISETTYEKVKDHFNTSYRGKIEAKNKGEINMYFVDWKTV